MLLTIVSAIYGYYKQGFLRRHLSLNFPMTFNFTWTFTQVKFYNPLYSACNLKSNSFEIRDKILTSPFFQILLVFVFLIASLFYTCIYSKLQICSVVWSFNKKTAYFKEVVLVYKWRPMPPVSVRYVLLHLVLFSFNSRPSRSTSDQQNWRRHRLYGMLAYSSRSKRTSSKMANVCGCFGE